MLMKVAKATVMAVRSYELKLIYQFVLKLNMIQRKREKTLVSTWHFNYSYLVFYLPNVHFFASNSLTINSDQMLYIRL
ncbi:hypothetical protein QVD17_16922 [Tagetes erecta]|uniref:Uncharacterized protein n=1 Tax=Tagetes erecta TaxID=13708 RepID=A0AAD8KSW8_TARER|nr:hypothetical protein QVD17_16922 [Tagetes erecta]